MNPKKAWRVAYWLLTAMFVATAALNMADVNAGFLTSYAADLCLPPWIYIVIRRLTGYEWQSNPVSRWFGGSPALAAWSLFLGSTLTELSQIRWPNGVFAGRFDPLDIVAYATGLFVCFAVDTRGARGSIADVPVSRVQETSEPAA